MRIENVVRSHKGRSSRLLAAAAALAALSAPRGAAAQPATRRVWAWADGSAAAVAQWRNASWRGVFDGVQASCGLGFVALSADAVELQVNTTEFDACRPLLAAVRETGGLFEVWTGGIPAECLTSAAAAASAAASAARVAAALGIDGLSLDDESDCAPRSTLSNFSAWSGVVDEIAAALGADGRSLSAAVQAMFGIQDVPYRPLCSPPEAPQCSQACALPPWAYAPNARVVDLMARSAIGRWLVMDTYYFTTARFLNAIDWYSSSVPTEKLSVAVMNRDDLSSDDLAARFHALDRAGVDLFSVFMLPASDEWLPWLRKWKTRCATCPNAGALSCYEPSLQC